MTTLSPRYTRAVEIARVAHDGAVRKGTEIPRRVVPSRTGADGRASAHPGLGRQGNLGGTMFVELFAGLGLVGVTICLVIWWMINT